MTKQIAVYLMAFGDIVPIPERVVDVPEADFESESSLLNSVYYHGQNDFQPKPVRSVSVGDVIKLPDGSLHRVRGVGFEALPAGTDIHTLERGHACFAL